MASSSKETGGSKKKVIEIHKTSSNHCNDNKIVRLNDESVASTPIHKDFIPLSARDSTFVDLTFYNSNCHTEFDDYADEKEVQVIDVDEEEKLPIFILFPGLKDIYPISSTFISNTQSTTNLTRMLVGQKADFSHMKNSQKITSTDGNLDTLPEMPQEESLQEVKYEQHISTKGEYSSDTDIVQDDTSKMFGDDDTDEDSKTKHIKLKKRTKKKSDVSILHTEINNINSSCSGINASTENLHEPTSNTIKQSCSTSDNFGDVETD